MEKKSKKFVATAPTTVVQPAKDPGPSKKGLISDTTCLTLGNTSWESIYDLIEAEELEEVSEEATTDSTDKSEDPSKI